MGQERVVWLAEKCKFGWNIFFGGKNIYALSSRGRKRERQGLSPPPTRLNRPGPNRPGVIPQSSSSLSLSSERDKLQQKRDTR